MTYKDCKILKAITTLTGVLSGKITDVFSICIPELSDFSIVKSAFFIINNKKVNYSLEFDLVWNLIAFTLKSFLVFHKCLHNTWPFHKPSQHLKACLFSYQALGAPKKQSPFYITPQTSSFSNSCGQRNCLQEAGLWCRFPGPTHR